MTQTLHCASFLHYLTVPLLREFGFARTKHFFAQDLIKFDLHKNQVRIIVN